MKDLETGKVANSRFKILIQFIVRRELFDMLFEGFKTFRTNDMFYPAYTLCGNIHQQDVLARKKEEHGVHKSVAISFQIQLN